MSAPAQIPDELSQRILSLEGRGYKAYKTLQDTVWSYAPFQLKFEHVQGDPFAWPTRLAVTGSLKDSGLPPDCHDTPLKRLALEDFLLRAFHTAVRRVDCKPSGSGKSGVITALLPGQKILKRSAVAVTGDQAMGKEACNSELQAGMVEPIPAGDWRNRFHSVLWYCLRRRC